MNYINSHRLNEDGSFTENKATTVEEKANELINAYGDQASDVATEVLNAIKHEDNRMYYEIEFWKKVIDFTKENAQSEEEEFVICEQGIKNCENKGQGCDCPEFTTSQLAKEFVERGKKIDQLEAELANERRKVSVLLTANKDLKAKQSNK